MHAHEASPREDNLELALLEKIEEFNDEVDVEHQVDPAEMVSSFRLLQAEYGDRQVINPHTGIGVSSFSEAMAECGPPLIEHFKTQNKKAIEELLNGLSPDFES